MPKNLIHEYDHSREEILSLLELIRILKEADKNGCTPQLLKNASLGMIFEEPSTRTRVSFEVAMEKLGGHALYLKPGEIHLGERESLADTARVLSRMCDAIMARCWKHETILGLAEYATVPVLNGLTDYNHPTQAVCDVFTMWEHLPQGKTLEGSNVTFISDATNVCSSTMFITTMLGMNFTHVAPKRYQAPAEWVETARRYAHGDASITITDNIEDSVRNADIIYTDLWWWCGQEDEIPDRRKAFMPNYQITMDLLSKAPAHCKLMHCLPASRGVEATDEALDSDRSIIFDQAENRMHTQVGLLAWLVWPEMRKASEALKVWHEGRALAHMNACGWGRKQHDGLFCVVWNGRLPDSVGIRAAPPLMRNMVLLAGPASRDAVLFLDGTRDFQNCCQQRCGATDGFVVPPYGGSFVWLPKMKKNPWALST